MFFTSYSTLIFLLQIAKLVKFPPSNWTKTFFNFSFNKPILPPEENFLKNLCCDLLIFLEEDYLLLKKNLSKPTLYMDVMS